MTVGQWILRVAIALAIMGALLLITPTFSVSVFAAECGIGGCTPYSGGAHSDPVLPCVIVTGFPTAQCVPEEIWTPFMAVVNLNEYFPLLTILVIGAFDVTLRVAMVGWWASMWVWKQVKP